MQNGARSAGSFGGALHDGDFLRRQDGEDSFLVLEVLRNPDAADIDGLDLIVEVSEDLSNGSWEPVDGAYIVENSPSRLEVRIPVNGEDGLFLRARLEGLELLE